MNLRKFFEKKISWKSAYWDLNSLSQVLINKHLWSNYVKLKTQVQFTQISSNENNLDQEMHRITDVKQ